MTYTINQDVDVNASVDIGNIQVSTNTISSTDTNGDILLSPNGTGSIGINTASPNRTLHITGSSGKGAIAVEGDCGTSSAQVSFFGSTYGMYVAVNNNTSGRYALAVSSSTSSLLYVEADGLVGVGTNDPKAKLHVSGAGDSGTSLASASRKYLYHSLSGVQSDTTTSSFGDASIYGTHRIVSSSSIISHGTSSYSDSRIKYNVVDIEDDSALQTIRLIKPKKYSYVDTIAKGTTPVWGFIAQEVSGTMDYAVEKMQKAIPNVYKIASVSEEGYVLTFDEPVSLELCKLQLNTIISEEYEVDVSEIISPTSVRLTEPITEEHHTGTLGDESIQNKVFVYGQYVEDFHVLKKDAIFTVAVAALQEIDRRQTSDNERILELESEVETLKAQVAALLQHTGVTV